MFFPQGSWMDLTTHRPGIQTRHRIPKGQGQVIILTTQPGSFCAQDICITEHCIKWGKGCLHAIFFKDFKAAGTGRNRKCYNMCNTSTIQQEPSIIGRLPISCFGANGTRYIWEWRWFRSDHCYLRAAIDQKSFVQTQQQGLKFPELWNPKMNCRHVAELIARTRWEQQKKYLKKELKKVYSVRAHCAETMTITP